LEDNVKIDLKEMRFEDVDQIHVAKERASGGEHGSESWSSVKGMEFLSQLGVY
jgi:hypothetical protein